MSELNTLFIELIQVSLGTREFLSREPSAHEWLGLFQSAQKQALVGILAIGIEKLPDNQMPPKNLLLQWIGLVTQIEARNSQLTESCVRLYKHLSQNNFNVCILKGQANHVYYPNSVASRRTCGDIDAWVTPLNVEKSPVKTIMTFLERHYEMTGLCWLHASINSKEGVPIEIHFRPSFMNEPLRNWRFQRHFKDMKKCSCIKEIDGISLPAMRNDEDVIYQMNHIYRHLIDEGVGLRQVVDYFFLLRSWHEQHTRSVEDTMKIISWLGMRRFAGALMFVLREACGMDKKFLLCPVSVSDGQFLMSEIMMAGNFGHWDPRMTAVSGKNGRLRSQLKRTWRRIKRNTRFFTSYPEEVFWEPIARLFHYAWKKRLMYFIDLRIK